MLGKEILLRKIAQASDQLQELKDFLLMHALVTWQWFHKAFYFVSTQLPAERSVNLELFSRETKSTNIETSLSNNGCLSIIGRVTISMTI